MGIQKLESKMLDENVGRALGYRNHIINGDMQVWQRGTSKAQGTAAYLADRWTCQSPAACDRSTDVPTGFKYSMKVSNFNVALGGFQINQFVENFGQFYNGQKVTFSCYLKANTATTIGGWGSIYWIGNDQTAHSTTLPNINLTTSWQRFSVTHTITNYNSSTSTALYVYPVGNFTTPGGTVTNSTEIYWTGAQLEFGEVATPFEYRSYAEELALCQRYFFQVNSTGASNGENVGMTGVSNGGGGALHRTNMALPVTMRTAPTISVSNVSGQGTDFRAYNGADVRNITGLGSQFSNPNALQADWTLTSSLGSAGDYVTVLWQNSITGGYLRASAEF